MPLEQPREEPMRSSPAFTRPQIDALIAFIGSFGGPAAPTANPSAGNLALGFHEFTLNCAGCHQIVARGGITVNAQVPDLQQATAQQIAEAVRMGPYLMSHFDSNQIDQRELDSIARYVLLARDPTNLGVWGIYNIRADSRGHRRVVHRPARARDRGASDRREDGRGDMSRLARLLGFLVAARAAMRAVTSRRQAPPPPPESDFDPRRRVVPSNRTAETVVGVLLILAALFGVGFTVVYVALDANTQLLGVAIGGALCLLAAAAIVAAKMVVPQETAVEERGPLLDEQETETVVEVIEAGGEGISRRGLLIGAGGVAGAAIATAAATPLASLGPRLSGLHQTPWARGIRLVDDQGRPYLAQDIQIGAFYTALPEHSDPEAFGAGLLVMRLPATFLHLPAARRAWAPDGIVAYSKICPHAGHAISLFRHPTYAPTSQQPAFTCPCHYSTFLPGEGGRVTFGPAGRSLPQLPLMVDTDGYLRAAGPFHEDIGPSWWGVHRSES
jgi:ubiquinol-cytochrome c reductase iron-sulfur subunit